MGKRYLIDTNVLLEFLSAALPEPAYTFVEGIINESFNISVINRIEILGHESATQALADFLDLSTSWQLTQDVERKTIELRRKKKIKLPDAIIAATALVHDFTIVTRNTKDFVNIDGLQVINPWNH